MNRKEFMGLLDKAKADVETMSSDVLLDVLDEIQIYHSKLIIEATKRSTKKAIFYEFTDKQIERMTIMQTNVTSRIFDELDITEEQSAQGSEIVRQVIFDGNR